MIIRRAMPCDAKYICEIENETFGDPWSQKDISSLIAQRDGICFVACENDGERAEVIAYVLGRLIAPEGEIYRIATKREMRKRGVGSRLLSFATKTERGRGLETIFLEVRKQNHTAISFYESHMFKKIGERKNYYKNPDDDAIIMLYGNLQY